jgi:two-component system OmpR family response regulator
MLCLPFQNQIQLQIVALLAWKDSSGYAAIQPGCTVVSFLELSMRVLSFLPRYALKRRVEKALSAAHFVVQTAESAKECSFATQRTHYDGVLVDSDSIDFRDSLALIQQLRRTNADAALFVFARYPDLEQRLALFEAGADDYVREPFFASEMTIRFGLSIRLHRAASGAIASHTINKLRSGDLELDLIRRRATRLGREIDLRPKEFLLLEYLLRNVNRPVTRTMILEHVWNSSFEGLTNVVDVYISSLRNKVDRDFPQKLIQTKRGIGYIFTCTATCRRPDTGRFGGNGGTVEPSQKYGRLPEGN